MRGKVDRATPSETRPINSASEGLIFTSASLVALKKSLFSHKNTTMHIHKLTYNPFQENTYIISDDDNNCVIIDPGCYFREEEQHLLEYIRTKSLKPLALLNTHAHLDHIMGNQWVKQHFDIDLYLHPDDQPLLSMADQSAQLYGLHEFKSSPAPDKWLTAGETLQFGGITLDVIFGPGHAPGHVAFYNAAEKFVINGDILFDGSYGRVDLPGGDFQTLKNTITQKMFALPEDTVVYTGHGGETTIGKEKRGNPILF
jgi:glyoxylase-like metal-dependent hydrolase (beta-lactamase superfamily II)